MNGDQSPPNPDTIATAGEYIVVARRYRPQQFDDLVGQEHVARALANAITSSRVGHAYLFTGARGVGKTSAARILAKALNCQSGPTAVPCNRCDICLGIGTGDDVDVLEIDGASNRGIDEIRQLRQNVNVRPSRARYKIYIIDEVHMLTKEAFNALLKTLEEPPEHVKFFFATTEPEKIPITIRSRCQRFDFAGIDSRAIAERLGQIVAKEGIQAEPAALAILARRAEGSMRDGQSLLEQLLAVSGGQISVSEVNALLGIASGTRLSSLIECIAARDAGAALRELDAGLAEGVDPGQYMEQLLGHLRDMMAAAVGCGADQFRYATPDQFDGIVSASKQIGLETLLAAVQIVEQTLARMRLSVYARTLAEVAIVRLCTLEDLDSLPALIDQLHGRTPPAPAVRRPAGPAAAPATSSSSAASPPSGPRGASTQPPTRRSETAEASGETMTASEAANGDESATAVDTPPPALETISLSESTARPLWEQAVRLLNEQNELVAVQANLFVDVATSAPNNLVVSFAEKYTACKAFCEKPEQRAKLEQALTRLAGQPLRLRFTLVPDAAPEAATSAAPRPKSRRQLEADVAGRPFVQRAMEIFDATGLRADRPD
ncbi:MAG: DNA polymerase III subunit gamma/tau [Pirellulales bacterium]